MEIIFRLHSYLSKYIVTYIITTDTTIMTSTTPRIAIIGAGPGGLTLARILHLNGIRASVFEREANPWERPQGGTLDLHEESGQLALDCAGLGAEFRHIARYEDQGSRLLDKHGKLLFEEDGADGNRPEVDRSALRDMLLAALPAGCVHWNHGLVEVYAAAGGWMLRLADGSVGPFDLVVGADGAWSRVRPLLSPYQPQYSGLNFIEFGIDDVDVRHPALSALVGRGKLGVEGDGREIIAQRNGNAHIRAYAIFRVPLEWPQQHYDFNAPAAVRQTLLEDFAGFADEVLELIRRSDDQFVARPIFALPVGHCWQHQRGLTLLGDAAHLMSPFGGEGVNAAMLDAAELAAQLVQALQQPGDHNRNWDTAVARYESHMFERVKDIAAASADAAAVQLSHDGLALTLAHMESHVIRPLADDHAG